MIYVVLAVVLGLAGLLFVGRGKGGRRGGSAAEKPDAGAAVPVAFDIDDPAIGNPRDRMKSLGWNQVVVLRHAADGLRIFHAEPGRSNSGYGVRYYYQARTVDSLINAGFLVPTGGGAHVITPLGFKALKTLPQRGN